MLRIEQRNTAVPIERKPEWIKTRAKMGPEFTELRDLVKREGLHTVCQEAGCPNIYECWEDREATFLIGGDQCTRRCDFCQIDTGKPAAAGHATSRVEWPRAFRHDGACGTPPSPAWPATILRRRRRVAVRRDGRVRSDALNPDTGGRAAHRRISTRSPSSWREVFSLPAPEVLAHNVETVPRVFRSDPPGLHLTTAPCR